MAATTAADQLEKEEMESACSMLLFVKGFAIAVLARTIEKGAQWKRNMMCPCAAPSGLTGLLQDKEFAFEGLAQCVWPWITATLNTAQARFWR